MYICCYDLAFVGDICLAEFSYHIYCDVGWGLDRFVCAVSDF